MYLVFRQGGQVIPKPSDEKTYRAREEWEFFDADIFTSRWYFTEYYLPRLQHSANLRKGVKFTKSVYFLDMEIVLDSMETMLSMPFMGGEVICDMNTYFHD